MGGQEFIYVDWMDISIFLFCMAEDDEVKESIEEYEKGERLDLEYYEPEYQPEEYDDKEIEQEDVQRDKA